MNSIQNLINANDEISCVAQKVSERKDNPMVTAGGRRVALEPATLA